MKTLAIAVLFFCFVGRAAELDAITEMSQQLDAFRTEIVQIAHENICDTFLESKGLIKEILDRHLLDVFADDETKAAALQRLERLERQTAKDDNVDKMMNRDQRDQNNLRLQRTLPRSKLYDFESSLFTYLVGELTSLEKIAIVAQAIDQIDHPWGASRLDEINLPGDEGRAYRLIQVLQSNFGIVSTISQTVAYSEMAKLVMTPAVMSNLVSEKMIDKTRSLLMALQKAKPTLHAELLAKLSEVATPEILNP